MKKIVSLLFAVFCFVLNVLAQDFESNGIYYDIVDDEELTVEVVYDESYSGDIIIPSTVDYNHVMYAVVSIDESAFSSCDELTSVTISEGVIDIWDFAFEECSNLTTVVLPASVEYLGEGVFTGCKKLKSIVIPEGVTDLWDDIFSDCVSLESVTLPNSLEYIGDFAFDGCSALLTINLPDGLETIGANAFEDCVLLQSINLPTTVKKIGNYAFSGCSSLNSVVIHEGVKSLPRSVFYDCEELVSIELPESLTTIGDNAFSGCDKLVSIELPANVESIGSRAFAYCSKLKEVTCKAMAPPMIESTSFIGIIADFYVPCVAIATYQQDTEWSDLAVDGMNKPVVSADVKQAICGQDIGEISLTISKGTEPYSSVWADGSIDLKKSELAPGAYSFSVTDALGCVTNWETEIYAESYKYNPQLALVTVSQEVAGANLVIWQKEETETIDYYSIYRETSSKDVYEKIADVPYSESSIFVDENTNNLQKSYRYKLSATDYCGESSGQSPNHKTIHLTKNISSEGGINLVWDGYEGFEFATYSVFRVTRDGVEEIDKVASDRWTYTDLNPVEGTISYYVGVVLPKEIDVNAPFMKAETGPFSLAISNIAEIENESAISSFAGSRAKVYSVANSIVVENADNQPIVVCSAMGQKIYSTIGSELTTISVPAMGTYIVIVAGKTFKVVVD
ncbi:MAG: leucine-rich repeat protein [Bacteroidales bacterium]|nr:leucine-rich repeat protein [Bacteroidales bacterium]